MQGKGKELKEAKEAKSKDLKSKPKELRTSRALRASRASKSSKDAAAADAAAAETVKKAVEMITVEGARIKDVARQLGVSQKELRTGIASYNGDFERCSVEVVDSMSDSLGIMARRALPKIFEVITERLNSPFSSLGEITGAARLFYDIYRKEMDDGNADGNDPVSRLFELRTKS